MAHVQEVLAGRYELLDVLGRGGMGVVYRATDRVLARPVAIKVLPVERAEDPSLVARFEREARAVAALNHPNVVALYDTGRDENTRFIVMEFVPGPNLAQVLRQRGHLPAAEAVRIATQIAAALAAAHRAGLIHRDIKPANVMVEESGRVKVLDFGIVRSTSGTSLTQTANVIGSAPYLAPEVARGEPAEERSDVYSLGCVLYEMLTGRPPFAGELPVAIMHQHDSAPPRPPLERNPAVAPALDALVLAMLAKAPRDRPGDAELAQALARPLADPIAAAAPEVTRTGATRPLVAPAARARGLGRRAKAVIAVVALLVIAAVALVLSGGSSSHRPHRSAAPAARSTPTHATTRATVPRTTTTTTKVPAVTPTRTAPAPTAPAGPAPAAGSSLGKGHGHHGDAGKPPKPRHGNSKDH